MHTLAILVPLAFAIAPISGSAMPDGHQGNHAEPRDATSDNRHHAHVHGIAELLVALEGEQLHIELLSPAVNMVGFEGAADSPERQVAMNNAREILQDAGKLFQIGRGECRLAAHEVDFGSLVASSGAHQADQDGEQNDGKHRKQDHQVRTHSDIRASYQYFCEQPKDLESVSVRLHSHFPGIQSVQAQWIVNGRQDMATLDNSQVHLVFR
ncbi:ZrgA family zinc uptake protein [Parahaliea mediterranea]|uniref:ZrgA family zinc uptake protein n=1 Tax=Parahaliea mediterranea TaxID=651086 RepID=UPI000E2F9AC5|nr:DUF2796 domain-containing protein [Parahaliea mediterranea]